MKKLSIPEHIPLDKEYLPGMGARELRQFLTAAAPGLVITILIWVIAREPGTQLLALMFGIAYIACCFGFLVKVDGSQSMYIFLSRILHFNRTQKHYFYKQGKEAIRYVLDRE